MKKTTKAVLFVVASLLAVMFLKGGTLYAIMMALLAWHYAGRPIWNALTSGKDWLRKLVAAILIAAGLLLVAYLADWVFWRVWNLYCRIS